MWRACALLVSAYRCCSCAGSGITACAVHGLRPKPLQGSGVSVASVAKVCTRQGFPGHTQQNAFCPLSRSVGSSCSDCGTWTGEDVFISNSIALFLKNIRLPPAVLHIFGLTLPECMLVHIFRKPIPQLGLLHLPPIPPMPSSSQDRSTHQG